MKRIRERVIRPVLESTLKVQELARAGMFPATVRGALGAEAAAALADTGHPSAVPVLEALRDRKGEDPRVVRACEEALESLRNPPAPGDPLPPADDE